MASAPELDCISQGKTFEEAKKNLLDVIQIQLKEMKDLGTLDEYLADCGFFVKGDRILTQKEIVGFEKSVVPMTLS